MTHFYSLILIFFKTIYEGLYIVYNPILETKSINITVTKTATK